MVRGPPRARPVPNALTVPDAPSVALPTLRDRVIGGLSWTVVGFAAAQAIRLGTNLLLTRLLFPEAFGIMALVQIVLQGIEMFSDAGLRGSVVNHERGEDPAFLDTVFSFQAIRGGVLWLITCLAAWPTAQFFAVPELVWLIPAAGLRALFRGFSSTSLLVLVRRVLPAQRVLLDLGGQLVGLLAMVGMALFITRSVWVLVAGALVANLFSAVGSHFVPREQRRPRFGWEPEAARALVGFGRWILISTALTFLLSQAERGVLGRLLSMADLGRFSIAFLIVQTFTGAVQRLSGNLLFPIYAELARDGPQRLRSRMWRVRAALLAALLPPLWGLTVFGPRVVELLYDDRYHEAGWMVQVLAAGAAAQLVAASAERVILAHGDSWRHMWLQVVRAALLVAGIATGGLLAGPEGVIVGAAVSRWIAYAPFAWAVRPYGIWMPGMDGVALALSAAVAAFALSTAAPGA